MTGQTSTHMLALAAPLESDTYHNLLHSTEFTSIKVPIKVYILEQKVERLHKVIP